MPTRYYQTQSEGNFPAQINAIVNRIKNWLAADVLYDNDDLADGLERIMMTDVTVEQGNRVNIQTYKKSNLTYPFTLFNIQSIEPNLEVQSHNAKSFHHYDSTLGCYISSRPRILTMPMFSFFATALDWTMAFKILDEVARSAIRLWVPITINSVVTQFPINITFTPANGAYAWQFEQWLTSNKLWDIDHTIEIKYYDIISDADVNEVDNFTFELRRFQEIKEINQLVNTGLVGSGLVIDSTDPADDDTDVPVENSVLIYTNSTIQEGPTFDFGDYLTIVPYFEHDVTISDDGKTILMDPHENLSSGTLYAITIDKSLKNTYGQTLEENFPFSFTTE